MQQKNSLNQLFFIFLSIIFLGCGGFIYLNFRPHTLVMFSWLKSIGVENLFFQKEFNNDSVLLSFFVYSAPNGLWSLSALILFGVIWRNSRKLFLIYTLIFSFINILFEMLQFFLVIPGTFDSFDILVLLISIVMGILTYNFFIRRNSYEY